MEHKISSDTHSYDLQLLDAYFKYLGNQTDSLLGMAAVGLTGIAILIVRETRSIGLWIYLSLIVSAVSFFVSIACGYLIEGASSGFFSEVIAKRSGCSPSKAIACFLDEGEDGYVRKLWDLSAMQLAAAITGFLWLGVPWWKIYRVDRRNPLTTTEA